MLSYLSKITLQKDSKVEILPDLKCVMALPAPPTLALACQCQGLRTVQHLEVLYLLGKRFVKRYLVDSGSYDQWELNLVEIDIPEVIPA